MESNAVLNAVVYQEADGRFTAEIPSCPGCASWGHSREEAIAKLREAAALCFMETTASDTAELSNRGRMIYFSYGGKVIRFLGPKCLVRFTDVKKWHDGYIEMMADNGGAIEEDYIDLVPRWNMPKYYGW